MLPCGKPEGLIIFITIVSRFLYGKIINYIWIAKINLLVCLFNYEAFGRELFIYDYSMGANNNVFRNVWPSFSLSPPLRVTLQGGSLRLLEIIG